MQIHNKLVLLAVFFVVLFSLYSCSEDVAELDRRATSVSSDRPQIKEQIQTPKKRAISTINRKEPDCQKFSLKFLQANNEGKNDAQGSNNIIIFDPKSKELDFKVSVALAHKIYAKDAKGKFRKEYIPKQFHEIIADDNAKLNGRSPIAAINADYIDPQNKPQGLNISRGVEYSGAFKDKRSSFGFQEGNPKSERLLFRLVNERRKYSITT
jgi:hypothetical protein